MKPLCMTDPFFARGEGSKGILRGANAEILPRLIRQMPEGPPVQMRFWISGEFVWRPIRGEHF